MYKKSTYLYLAIAVGMVCFALIDKKAPGTEEREQAELQVLKFDLEDVIGLEIKTPGSSLIFGKNGSHWEIKSPIATLADTAAIEGVLNQIADARPLRVIRLDSADAKTESTLKDWGLNPPSDRVVIHLKNKNDLELLVGRKIVVNDAVYARASGRRNEPIRIIPVEVKTALEKPLSEFRSRALFEFDETKVTRIGAQIATPGLVPGQSTEVDRKGEEWTLQKPVLARAATAQVKPLLAKLTAARITDFVTDDASNLATYGLTSPSATLSLAVQPAEELVLQIGGLVEGKPDLFYAKRLKSNSVFTLAKGVLAEILQGLANVRDRHVLAFDPGRVTGLKYQVGDKKIEAHQRDRTWTVTGEYAGAADIGKITDALTQLAQLETTPLLIDAAGDLKKYGLDRPSGSISIESPEFRSTPTVSLLLGKVDNKLVYVKNSKESVVYTLPQTAFSFLPNNNLSLRDHRVINVDLKTVRGLTVSPADAPTLELERSAGGTWRATNVKDRMVESTKAEAQASLLSQLLAKNWLGPVLPGYNLNKPILRLSLILLKEKGVTLRIGAALPDGSHAAQVEGAPGVFALGDGDFGLLSTSSLQAIPPSLIPGPAPKPVSPK